MSSTDAKEQALYLIDVAREILPSSASTDDIIAAAKKLGAYVDGTDVSAVEEVANTPEVARLELFRVEYQNRSGDGAHWGKVYKTRKGAEKNSKNPAFIRAVRFVEAD